MVARDLARRHRHQRALVHADLAGEGDQFLAQVAFEVELDPALAAQGAQVAHVRLAGVTIVLRASAG